MALVHWTPELDPTRCPTCKGELGVISRGRVTGMFFRPCRTPGCLITLVLPAPVESREAQPMFTPSLPYECEGSR